MTANLCLPDGTGCTLVPVPTCLVAVSICYAVAVTGLMRAGVSGRLAGSLLAASVLLGLPLNSVLMRAVRRLFSRPDGNGARGLRNSPDRPVDGKAALAYGHSLWGPRQAPAPPTTTSAPLSTWPAECAAVLAVPCAALALAARWQLHVPMCVAAFQICLLLFAWVAQILTHGSTLLDLWFTRQYKDERIDLLLAHIERVGADVVCLQEAIPTAWTTRLMERIVLKAAAIGLEHSCASPTRPELGMQFLSAGQLLLSRFPIRRHHWRGFDEQAAFEHFLCTRGSLYAELELPDGSPLHIGAAHTTSGWDVILEALHLEGSPLYSGGNPIALAQVREWADQLRAQLKLATDRDAAKSRHPWRVVLCCDLNITPVMREYEDVVVALGTICKGGVHDVSAGKWEPTFGLSEERLLTQAADRGNEKTNDYLFVGPGTEHMPTRVRTEALEAKEEEHARYQQVSDHKAVVAHWD